MNPNDGTFYQFRDENAKEKHEEMLRKHYAEKMQAFERLISVTSMPDPNCEICGGAGSKKSKLGFGDKYILCSCVKRKSE